MSAKDEPMFVCIDVPFFTAAPCSPHFFMHRALFLVNQFRPMKSIHFDISNSEGATTYLFAASVSFPSLPSSSLNSFSSFLRNRNKRSPYLLLTLFLYLSYTLYLCYLKNKNISPIDSQKHYLFFPFTVITFYHV